MIQILPDKASDLGESSDYTSNLLGNIRSHLQGLQGFDTMALELIQNADDAKAKQIIFDVRDDGLQVWNSGTFTYCGDLGESSCPYHDTERYSCDFHRISDFGSGGKLSRSENIGRFGIGFSSTYQIADNPEIRSAGIRLTLVPEEGKCYRKTVPDSNGTTFYLPWASDPNSRGRQALGVSHVTPEHIEQVVEDCGKVLHRSLLFLRHLEKAELRRNGQLVLSVEMDRSDEAELIVSFQPSGEVESWFIVRADAASQTETVYERYPQLEPLERKTEISVAIRVDPEPLDEGFLYAFLPTRQSTGFPFHLNADFFPEDSRKAIIFEGHQHQQAWNELLVQTAATALAGGLEGLRDRLGHLQLWELLSRAFSVSQNTKTQYPDCLKSFWGAFKNAIDDGAKVGYSAKGEYENTTRLLMPRKPLSESELVAFHQIGGELIDESLRSYRNTFIALGGKELTLERFVAIADGSLPYSGEDAGKATPDRIDATLKPLWSITENLLPESISPSSGTQQIIDDLKTLEFIVDTDLNLANIDKCYRSNGSIKEGDLAPAFPFLTFISAKLASFPKLYSLVDRFDIACAAEELDAHFQNGKVDLQELISGTPVTLKNFYTLLASIDEFGIGNEDAYATLKRLPIWLIGNGLSSAENALLPGNFRDPTGQADLLEPSVLSEKTKEFIERKLKVKRQTIEAFVRTVVPLFFGANGPENIEAYQRLMASLADHAGLLDNDEIRTLLAQTPLIPTCDGDWKRPDKVYFRRNDLAELIGDYSTLWVDEKRLPGSRSVRAFVSNLGILNSPIAHHLVDRILEVAQAFPPDTKARKMSEIAFYTLGDIYEKSEGNRVIANEINRLVSVECFPVDGNHQTWFMPEDVYAPFRYQAFQSQANILDFKNTQSLSSELLKAVYINVKPETHLVVDHLIHCTENSEPASNLVYQVLNERAKKEDEELYRLRGKRCIYLGSQHGYVRPNQLYMLPQALGKYSFTVPGELDQYKDLFSVLGIKDKPDSKDYVDIILDIVEEFYPKQAQLPPDVEAIYHNCMQALVYALNSRDDVCDEALGRLRSAPTVLNLEGNFCHPDEVLLHDSDWHASHFGEELSPALCKPDSEWWAFFEVLGVRRLTRMASIDLDYTDGIDKTEEQIRDKILERSGIFIRMLYDKPIEKRKKLAIVFKKLSVRSYDEVRVIASVTVGETPVSSEPVRVKAFCDKAMENLVLARPVEGHSWLHIFNVLLHRLMPEESALHISQISMNFFQMIDMSAADAEEFLTEANIPLLESGAEEGAELDLLSPEVGGIGEDEPDSADDDSQVEESPEAGDLQSQEEVNAEGEQSGSRSFAENGDAENNVESQGESGGADRSGSFDGRGKRESGKPGKRKHGRTPGKKAWDRKLISYVKQREPGNESEVSDSEIDRKYRLSIEAASRELVCSYERDRGREPEEMPQTHPGFDIISRNQGSEEVERYIEVKGTSSEWKTMGVSVSRLQFSEAQNYGDKYWLYVVEHALDEDCARIYAIQSPAMKVDSFMFDGEWRKVASEEAADPTLRYTIGVRIDCLGLGEAIIEKVVKRGQAISLAVDFGMPKGKRFLPLNLKTMRIIEEDDGTDDPQSE